MFRVAVITGASRGIGAEIARQLSVAGYELALIASGPWKETPEYPTKTVTYQVDVSDFTAVKQTVADIKKEFGQIDVLVNNAGMFYFSSLVNMPLSINAKTTLLHVYTPTLLCSLFGNEMKKRKKGLDKGSNVR